MLQVIYTSTAVSPCTTETLGNLLIQARARNLANEITGMLIYDFGRFLQVIEGPEEKVQGVLASILRDPRHRDILTLSYAHTKTREFKYWSMAFLDLPADGHPIRPPLRVTDVLTGIDSAVKAKRYLREFQGDLYYQVTFRDQTN